MGYSIEEKLKIIRIYYANNRNPTNTQNYYHLEFPGRTVPTRSTIRYIVRKFEETKSLNRKRRTINPDQDFELNVLLFFTENPERSIPDAVRYFQKSFGKIQKILDRYNYHPYKFLPVHGLTEQHKQQRLLFCQEILRRRLQNPQFLNNILFTDEATFTTNGMFNRRNKHFWATTNPHKIQEVKIQGRQSLNVWCGILKNRVIGPIFFRGNLNGARYLEYLENDIEEQLDIIPLNQRIFVWQQDGAPAHNVLNVTNFLNRNYNLWIGRNGPIRWPANSPDLTPLDIFLWGYLKNKIYYNRPENINVLEQRIREEITNLNENYPQFILHSINRKLLQNIEKCFANQGGHVEN